MYNRIPSFSAASAYCSKCTARDKKGLCVVSSLRRMRRGMKTKYVSCAFQGIHHILNIPWFLYYNYSTYQKSIWIPPTSPFSLLSVSFYDREREMGITIMCVAYPAKVCTLYGKYFTSTLHYSLYNNNTLNLKSDNILTYFLHSLKCRLKIMIIIIFFHLKPYSFCNTWI